MRTLPSAASRPPPRCWRAWLIQAAPPAIAGQTEAGAAQVGLNPGVRSAGTGADRKSTRLNSSHQIISYAVFCLKKKKTKNETTSVVNSIELPTLYTELAHDSLT